MKNWTKEINNTSQVCLRDNLKQSLLKSIISEAWNSLDDNLLRSLSDKIGEGQIIGNVLLDLDNCGQIFQTKHLDSVKYF